jgi:hypothetical protein
MKTTSTEIHYRISSRGGTLFVRELIYGQVVGRVRSDNLLLTMLDAEKAVQECRFLFVAPVQEFVREEDEVIVRCQIQTPNTVTNPDQMTKPSPMGDRRQRPEFTT